MTDIPEGTFDSLVLLERLDLSRNKIETLRRTAFSTVSRLEVCSTCSVLVNVKVCSYISLNPVRVIVLSALPIIPYRLVHSNAISTSMEMIQPHSNYCAKTIRSHTHHCQVLVYRRVNCSNVG